MRTLTRDEWEPRARDHEQRVDALVAPHLARREAGERHPVHDFLFTYYSHRPSQLRRWHPGYGVRLLNAPEHEALPAYRDGAVTSELLGSRRALIEALHRLLAATAARPATLGCFGLHEWAMVHRAERDEIRHPWPLRLGAVGTDAVVESHRITCSHFDAFRFFTPSARPLNTLSPASDDRADFEQPGCLHAGMDLYKHAFRLSPLVPSELVVDCFELAWEIRVMDMRAAPYDLTGVVLDHTGEAWTPVCIETPEGKREYATAQQRFAERGSALRAELVAACAALLSAARPTELLA